MDDGSQCLILASMGLDRCQYFDCVFDSPMRPGSIYHPPCLETLPPCLDTLPAVPFGSLKYGMSTSTLQLEGLDCCLWEQVWRERIITRACEIYEHS